MPGVSSGAWNEVGFPGLPTTSSHLAFARIYALVPDLFLPPPALMSVSHK